MGSQAKVAAGGLGWTVAGSPQPPPQLVPHSHVDKPGITTGEWDWPRNRVPAWGNKAWKPLTEKTCEGWGFRRNSQPHRRVHWRDPQGPRTYTNPPTQESASEGPSLLVGSRGNDWKPAESEAALFSLRPLPLIQCHNPVTWIAPPRWTPKAPPLTM